MSAGPRPLPDDTATELQRLVQQLWSAGSTRVVVGPSAPEGYRVVEQYVATPSLAAARMLLPAQSRQARAKALSQYNQLRRGRVRAGRSVLAAGVRTGLDRRVLRDIVSICVPAGATDAQVRDQLATQQLIHVLGRGALHAAIGVGNPSPNRKPTLQLFEPDGAPAAFVKVGWNELTRSMVENEADALGRLAAAGISSPRRPAVARIERWHDMVLLATEPMPLAIRRQPATSCPPLDLSALGGPEPARPVPLSRTPFWHRLLARADELGAEASEPNERGIVAAAIDVVAASGEHALVTNQAWHGDWVHWNMATYRDQLWVWDWEHFSDDAPQCFDALHFWFQDEFIIRQSGFADAMARASAQTAAERTAVFGAEAAALIPFAYVLEVYLRAARMARLGADWDPRLHAPAVGWLAAATTAAS